LFHLINISFEFDQVLAMDLKPNGPPQTSMTVSTLSSKRVVLVVSPSSLLG
jgi:hypothetical protein